MEWTLGWRDRVWSQLDQEWDVLIVGGGITGAGILRQCVRAGLRALLVEANDFASGTSSRSSKLVHGGMRYLKNAQLKITFESVTEREYMLQQGRGLINRLGFLYASLNGDKMPGWVFGAGLTVYDIMARQWTHRSYDLLDMQELCPILTSPKLHGGYRYFDAQTDDARLVLRLLRESAAAGGFALNYARVDGLLRTTAGQVCGVQLFDLSGDAVRQAEVKAKVVINATGAWTDELRHQARPDARLRAHMRPLRGSHLVIPVERIPITRAVSFLHPKDGRPVFALPWEGVVIFGTTDVDHKSELKTDPAISSREAEYLMEALQYVFPEQELSLDDVQSTFSGLRPVVDTGKTNPSKESREHVIWDENGLLTVSGGKLTTFRLMARDALKAVRHRLGEHTHFAKEVPVLDPLPMSSESLLADERLTAAQRLRLLGRYGAEAARLPETGWPGEWQPIGSTPYLWGELRHAARAEGVVHLADLLLRRVRLGFVAPNGGLDQIERIRQIVQPELEWDDTRWQAEVDVYRQTWKRSYRL